MAKIKHKSTGIECDSGEFHGVELHEVSEGDGGLLISNPPSGFHRVYNIYLQKTGGKYHPIFIVEDIPEP